MIILVKLEKGFIGLRSLNVVRRSEETRLRFWPLALFVCSSSFLHECLETLSPLTLWRPEIALPESSLPSLSPVLVSPLFILLMPPSLAAKAERGVAMCEEYGLRAPRIWTISTMAKNGWCVVTCQIASTLLMWSS